MADLYETLAGSEKLQKLIQDLKADYDSFDDAWQDAEEVGQQFLTAVHEFDGWE